CLSLNGVSSTNTSDGMYYIGKIEKLIRQSIPVSDIPSEVFVEETPFKERQAIAREIDSQKKKENPDFKGAFHEKKHAHKHAAAARNKAGASRGRGKGKSFKKK